MDTLVILETVDSTNAEARRRWAAGPLPHGTAFVGLAQVAGRGQQGRTWHAEPGKHLAMTVVLRPAWFTAADLPVLNMKASLGVAKALNTLEPDLAVRIKWPNDIFVGDRKLAGILIENILAGQAVSCTMAGIGLNVNEASFPPDLPFAVSLRQLTGRTRDVIAVAETVRTCVLREIERPGTAWRTLYRSILFGRDARHTFDRGGDIATGIIRDVDDRGRLVLENENGARDAFYAHEIKWQR
jgi:BirA family biotin operon repressor/biotin-[acetyl-CoA-carboxylase] ligase